jgi:uncharacterized Rossmann fold enzyme
MTNWSDERRRFMADMGKAGEWSAMLNTHMNRLWIENEMPQYVEEIGGMCDLQDDAEVLILGGSPRAADQLDKIEDAQNRGVPILACNGAGQWMVDKGLRPPEMVIVIDHNLRCLRYLQTDWLPDMTLLGQTVDPQLMKHCEAERRPTRCFNIMPNDYGWPVVMGGSTVTGRALFLASCCGFRSIHLIGADSDFKHGEGMHAYPHPDDAAMIAVRAAEDLPWRVSTPNLAAQAQEIPELLAVMTLINRSQRVAVYTEDSLLGDHLLAFKRKGEAFIATEDDMFEIVELADL